MMNYIDLDELERDHGTAILSELTGQHLSRNQQPVRLFDQTRHGAEYFFRADSRTGKPYIQDFQNSKRYYPVTAYCQVYGVDFTTALADLGQQYYLNMATERTGLPARPVEPAIVSPQIDYLPTDYYERSRIRFERNGLYEYLRYTYGSDHAEEVFNRYRLGTSRRWQYYGYLSTCLPQFDRGGNLRQVKIMPFDAMNGRRVKKHQQAQQWNYRSKQYEPTATDSDKTYFAGRQLAKEAGQPDVYLQQCFFGEHLLTAYPDQQVGIVEGESTALECSLLWPQFVWLATGGSAGAGWTKPETFGVLRGRSVTLWPDTGKFIDWSQKAALLRPLVDSLRVSEYVEKHTPAGMGNVDLRDLLTRPCMYGVYGDNPIYGEVLAVELVDSYPAEWGR